MNFFAQILPPCFWPWFFKTLNPKAEGFMESLTLGFIKPSVLRVVDGV
jgi:hypothetical protein